MGRLLAFILAIIIIALGAWAIFWRGNSNDNLYGNGTKNNNMPQSNKMNDMNSGANSNPVATNKVTIANFAFSPANITVKKGTAVTWTNTDNTQHTATENDGKNGPSAPPLSNGQSYSFTFDQVGVFHYHCSFHHDMTGTVTVTE